MNHPLLPRLSLLSALTLTMLACSSPPTVPASLLQARSDLGDARSDPQLQAHATEELALA